jgi:hypothetical protein
MCYASCIVLGGGFAKLVQLSDELTEFFDGVFEMQRTEVTKKMWVYIKAKNLQNPSNKREILCDEKLEKLFKRKKVDMFKMTKLLSGVSTTASFCLLNDYYNCIYVCMYVCIDRKSTRLNSSHTSVVL